MANIKSQMRQALAEVSHHLRKELLPYWMTRGLDTKCGGYLTCYDGKGMFTGATDKPLLTHARFIYAMSAAHRAGHGKGKCLARARHGVKFLTNHHWDEKNGGWFWILDRKGRPTVDPGKTVYGHAFAIYGLSEYHLASGDPRALEWAERTHDIIQTHGADNVNGGYFELMDRAWNLQPGGAYGGDRKSMDVHMHLMEAFTKLYAASGKEVHRKRALQSIDILFDHIIDPRHGTGVAQFAFDWTPLRAIIFKTVWGADRDVKAKAGRPMNNTSYGHNVEFGWLLNEALGILKVDRRAYLPRIKRLYDHCIAHGIDWKRGGIYCEGGHTGPAREKNKEFWQQSEALTAMLDGVEWFGPKDYWDAYWNIHRFVFDTMINHEVGEWWPLFTPDNKRIWEYMSTYWKINYHTIRSMLECERRLKMLLGRR